MRALRTA